VIFFHQLQRGKCLEKMVYIDDYYLFSIDGTGYFSSNKIHCKSCCTKTIRKTHPYLRLIVVEDSLYSNAPHIRELEKHNLKYIIGAKEGDHAFLFNYIESVVKDKLTTEIKFEKDGVAHQFRFMNNLPINESNQDQLERVLKFNSILQLDNWEP
jgi:hypothetical protein